MTSESSQCDGADESGASISPSGNTRAVLQSTAQEEDTPVLALGGKRLRMTAAELLESEGDVNATDLEEFVDRMESMNVEAGSEDWNKHWKRHAEMRLEEHDPERWAEYVRRRDVETPLSPTTPTQSAAPVNVPPVVEEMFERMRGAERRAVPCG